MPVPVDWSTVVILIGTLLVQHSSCSNNIELWQTSCPYNNFCTSSSSIQLNDTDETTTPCCTDCSCDADCWVFNNCCPDVPHGRPVDVQTATCTTLHVLNNLTKTIVSYENNYRMIDFCPREYDVINRTVVDQCEWLISADTDFDDIVAVSDANNRIYKNKHCAVCHDVIDVKRWRLQLKFCRDGFEMYDSSIPASMFTQQALENCHIMSVPTNSLMEVYSESMACGTQVISKCSSSFGQDGHSPSITDACLNGPDILYRDVNQRGKLILYKNVMCYLCNKGVVQTMCLPSDLSSGKTGFDRFSLLLDIDLDATNKPTANTNACSETEVYIAAKGGCMQLSCPPYHVVSYGRCVPMGNLIDGYGIVLRIQYEPLQGPIKAGEILEYDAQKRQQYIYPLIRKYGLKSCQIIESYLGLFTEKTRDTVVYVVFDIMISFGQDCTLDDIAKAVRSFESKNDTVTLGINTDEIKFEGKFSFLLKHVLDWKFGRFDDRWHQQTLFVFKSQTLGFYQRSFFLCPYFAFNVSEYNSIETGIFGYGKERNMTEISELTRVEDGFYTLSTDTVAVCMDTYFELYNRNDGRLNFGHLTEVLSMNLIAIWLTIPTYVY